MFFLFVMLVVASGVKAQDATAFDRAPELIVNTGAGLYKTDSTISGNYGYVQAKFMIGKGQTRFGIFGQIVGYGENQLTKKPNPASTGTEISGGIAFDSYGQLSYSYDSYFYLNAGAVMSTDKYDDGIYQSTQNNTGVYISGGWFVTDVFQGWFGNNRIMFDCNIPVNSKIKATWKGEPIVAGKPYNKQAFRVVAESGIKRFGKTVQTEFFLHLGGGKNYGQTNAGYTEIGAGVDLGLMKVWYREIMKVGVFWRQNMTNGNSSSVLHKGTLVAEINISPSALIQALKANK